MALLQPELIRLKRTAAARHGCSKLHVQACVTEIFGGLAGLPEAPMLTTGGRTRKAPDATPPGRPRCPSLLVLQVLCSFEATSPAPYVPIPNHVRPSAPHVCTLPGSCTQITPTLIPSSLHRGVKATLPSTSNLVKHVRIHSRSPPAHTRTPPYLVVVVGAAVVWVRQLHPGGGHEGGQLALQHLQGGTGRAAHEYTLLSRREGQNGGSAPTPARHSPQSTCGEVTACPRGRETSRFPLYEVHSIKWALAACLRHVPEDYSMQRAGP